MTMIRSIIAVIILVLAGLAGYQVAQPYFVLKNMQNAIEERDAEKINALIDYTSLRANIKQQISLALEKGIDKLQEQSLYNLKDGDTYLTTQTLAVRMVDQLVDITINPENLAETLKVTSQKKSNIFNADLYSVDTRYVSHNAFHVYLTHKETNNVVELIMMRQGRDWKFTNVVVPGSFVENLYKNQP